MNAFHSLLETMKDRKTKLSTRNLYKKSSIVFKEIGYLNEKERERRIW
jgi:hypothetical protein